jgi:hypothetical protein
MPFIFLYIRSLSRSYLDQNFKDTLIYSKMKNILLSILVLALLNLTACKQAETEEADTTTEVTTEVEVEVTDQTETFNKRVGVLKAYLQAHCDEDIEAMKAVLSDTLKWSPPNHTEGDWLGKEDLVTALLGYQADYDDITYNEGIVLPGDNGAGYFAGSHYNSEGTGNSAPNAIRCYGTWNATHVASGKSIKLKWYGIVSFNADDKIIMSTEYFDVGGLVAQVQGE